MKSFKLFPVIKEQINVACEVSTGNLLVFTKYQEDASNCLPILHPLTPSNVVFLHATPLKPLYQKLSMMYIPSLSFEIPILPTALEYPGNFFILFLCLSPLQSLLLQCYKMWAIKFLQDSILDFFLVLWACSFCIFCSLSSQVTKIILRMSLKIISLASLI